MSPAMLSPFGSLGLYANPDKRPSTTAPRVMDPIGTPRRPISDLIEGSQVLGKPARPGTSSVDSHSQDSNVGDLWRSWERIKLADCTTHAFIEDVLTRYGYLAEENARLKQQSSQSVSDQLIERDAHYNKDYARWNDIVVSDVDAGPFFKQVKKESQTADPSKNRQPHALVLIDGDGMSFTNDFLRHGEEGGKQAAHSLKMAVRQWLSADLKLSSVEVTIRIFANVRGLANVLLSNGAIASPDDFHQFVQGFTRGDALCDFIDVGPGKDRADAKVVANLNLYLRNIHCKQIILGCSHDNGYARTLESYAYEEELKARITMLEGVPFEKELDVLPFRQHRFPGLFRGTKLVAREPMALTAANRSDSRNSSAFNPGCEAFTPRSATPSHACVAAPLQPPGFPAIPQQARPNPIVPVAPLQPSVFPANYEQSRPRTTSVTSSTQRSENLAPPSAVSTPGGGPSMWSSIAGKAATLPFKDLPRGSTQVVIKPGTKSVLVNKQGYRLDGPMEYDHAKVAQLKLYKLCNQHYIGKGCCHHVKGNGNCPHSHDRKLTSEELKYLRVVSRETVCRRGVACRDPDCIYGHMCPYPKQTEGTLRGIGCVNGPNCRFGATMHNMDLKVDRVLAGDELDRERGLL